MAAAVARIEDSARAEGFLHVTKIVEQSVFYGTKATVDVTSGRWSKEMTAEDRATGCVGRVFVNMTTKEVEVTAWNGLYREEEAGVCERIARFCLVVVCCCLVRRG
jgi:hypothetical protein